MYGKSLSGSLDTLLLGNFVPIIRCLFRISKNEKILVPSTSYINWWQHRGHSLSHLVACSSPPTPSPCCCSACSFLFSLLLFLSSTTSPLSLPLLCFCSVSFLCSVVAMPSKPSVCQGIQSCLEPRQPHPSKLKPEIHRWVRPSGTHQDPVMVEKVNEKEMDSVGGGGEGGWSSIYSLCSPSQSPLEAIDKSFSSTKSSPPPPTVFTKRSMPWKKNLAMCTETLGCETGAVYDVNDFNGDVENRHTGRPKGGMAAKRSKRGSTVAGFPPPLTTLSGDSRLRILSKRENGRLLLLPVKPPVIEAERIDGRLRLRLYSDKLFHSNDKKVEELGKEEVEKEEEEEEEEGEEEEEEENEEDLKEENDEETEEDGGYLGVVGMEMNEMSYNGINGGEEMGVGKYRRPGGCKEEEGGGHRRGTSRGKPMLNWEAEAFWVASS